MTGRDPWDNEYTCNKLELQRLSMAQRRRAHRSPTTCGYTFLTRDLGTRYMQITSCRRICNSLFVDARDKNERTRGYSRTLQRGITRQNCHMQEG